jgi:riboflavin kinase/FMN adenylyltransferase
VKTIFGRARLQGPEHGSAVAIGTFDGVHIGHRALIARAREEAADSGAEAAVVTWDRHPAATLRPDAVPKLLTSPERKVELLQDTGVELLAVLEFDRALSMWPPERFAREVLASGLRARAVFVGEGWRFGHRAAGDVGLLKELGEELGFKAWGVPLAEVGGGPASSSRAREAVARGDLETATALLGRRFDLDGVVSRGDDRGKRLGWPTANLAIDPAYAHPPRGVYAARARARGRWYSAAVNLGVNPTFGGEPERTPLRIEAYLLDFDDDLYGERLRIEFHARLRDELEFGSEDELSAQIARDVDATRALTC